MKHGIITLLTALALCATMQAQDLFAEDFESVAISGEVGALPEGWVMYTDDHTNVSNLALFGTGWVVSQVETGNNALASVSAVNESGDCDRWVVTPAVRIPAEGYSLTFRAYALQNSSSEKLMVKVSTTGSDKESFTVALRDIVFNGTDGATAGWNNFSLALDEYAGQEVRIAFVNHGHANFIFVDDVKMTVPHDNFHMVLMESFTSQYCGQCPDGHEMLEGAYEGLENRVAWVSHHAGFQNDAMTCSASTAMEALYNTGTYAPAVCIDRDMRYSTEPGPVHYVGDAMSMHDVLARASSYQDNIVLGFTSIECNAASRQLSVTVDGYFLDDMTITNPHLTVYLVEDSIIAFQNGQSNSNYRHDHVLRGSLTDAWGDADAFTTTTAGTHFGKTFTYNLPQTVRPDKCSLVAFVTTHGSTVTQRRVLNSTKSGYITNDRGGALAIDDAEADMVVKVYPNPATEVANIYTGRTIRSLTVLNSLGQVVGDYRSVDADIAELNVSALPAGIYLVRAVTDGGTFTAPLCVSK